MVSGYQDGRESGTGQDTHLRCVLSRPAPPLRHAGHCPVLSRCPGQLWED